MRSPFWNALLIARSFAFYLYQESTGRSGLPGLCGSTPWEIDGCNVFDCIPQPCHFSLALSNTLSFLPALTFGLSHAIFWVGPPPIRLPNNLLLLQSHRDLVLSFHSFPQYLTSALPINVLYSLKQLGLRSGGSRLITVFTVGLLLYKDHSWRQHSLRSGGPWIEGGALHTSLRKGHRNTTSLSSALKNFHWKMANFI